jgi:hypothetical protein
LPRQSTEDDLTATPAPAWKEARPIHISGYDRKSQDYYPTPDWVTETLVRHVPLRGPVWEPCCGDGAIARVLQRHRHRVEATDLADWGFGRPGIDFFAQQDFPAGCKAMVTNPPYGDGGEIERGRKSPSGMLRFVRHALALTQRANGQLALLVRFQWLAGRRASTVISAGPLSLVVVLTHRITWFDHGPSTNAGQHHHAWLFWDCAHDPSAPPSLIFGNYQEPVDLI